MVHIIKIALLVSTAILPALAAPLNADSNELIAREPHRRGRGRGGVGRVFGTANRIVSGIGSTVTRIGAAARRVNSVVSSIRGMFGRELEPEEELFLRDILEDLHARAFEYVLESFVEIFKITNFFCASNRDFDDLDAREVFDDYEELD